MGALATTREDGLPGVVVWITGPPSSGKSTLARALRGAVMRRGYVCALLDGDAVRGAIVPPHGYSEEGRVSFYATLARLAALLCEQGFVVLVAATAHQEAYRALARELCVAFVEVLVDTPPEECEARDTRGLYKAVRAGDLVGVPGADLPFERPRRPDVVAHGGADGAAVSRIIELLSGSLGRLPEAIARQVP